MLIVHHEANTDSMIIRPLPITTLAAKSTVSAPIESFDIKSRCALAISIREILTAIGIRAFCTKGDQTLARCNISHSTRHSNTRYVYVISPWETSINYLSIETSRIEPGGGEIYFLYDFKGTGLRSFIKPGAAGRVQLASQIKEVSRSHYKEVKVRDATNESVCVQNVGFLSSHISDVQWLSPWYSVYVANCSTTSWKILQQNCLAIVISGHSAPSVW